MLAIHYLIVSFNPSKVFFYYTSFYYLIWRQYYYPMKELQNLFSYKEIKLLVGLNRNSISVRKLECSQTWFLFSLCSWQPMSWKSRKASTSLDLNLNTACQHLIQASWEGTWRAQYLIINPDCKLYICCVSVRRCKLYVMFINLNSPY